MYNQNTNCNRVRVKALTNLYLDFNLSDTFCMIHACILHICLRSQDIFIFDIHIFRYCI